MITVSVNHEALNYLAHVEYQQTLDIYLLLHLTNFNQVSLGNSICLNCENLLTLGCKGEAETVVSLMGRQRRRDKVTKDGRTEEEEGVGQGRVCAS